jgi:outer membrane protein OmpA-like peptidoglycan-associated protein
MLLPELDELLSGLRHLRRRAARGDLAWIDQRFVDGRLQWLQKLLPPGGYDRLGRDLASGNAAGVVRALGNIDDTTVGARLGYVIATRRVGAYTPEDEPLLVSIEPDTAYLSQQSTAPHHPLEEFAIDPEPLDAAYDFGGTDDPYFRDDYTFNDRFDAAVGTGYDDGDHDDRGDRIVIVDEAVAGATRAPRPRTRTIGLPPGGPFGDSPRRPNPLTWLFVLAGLVLVFALIFSRCGGDDSPNGVSTDQTTTIAQTQGTQGVVPATSVAGGAGTTVAPGATGPTSGVRTPTTWIVYFAVNSTSIDSAGQQVVSQIAERLRAYGAGTPVVIIGHSDTTGNPAANLQLAQTRALVVRDAIEAAAPQLGKFSVESKGDSQPDPDPSRSRRVTITVS